MDSAHFTKFDHLLAYLRQMEVLKRLWPGERLIDLGCGADPVLLRKASPFIEWGVGIDYDAKPLAEKNILVRNAQVLDRFPLPDGSATAVSMTAVLEHFSVPDSYRLLNACARVLAPHGRVILTTPTPEGKWPLETVAKLTPLIAKGEVFDHKHYYSKQDISYIAARSGFFMHEYHRFELGGNSVAVLIKQ